MAAAIDHSFPQFSRMPKEIRLLIWEMALPDPRVVTIESKPMKKAAADESSRGFFEFMSPIGITSDSSPPHILLACREAFSVVSKFYEPVFCIFNSFPETYFNFDLDTVYLNSDLFELDLMDSMSLIADQENLQQVHHLAILLDASRLPLIQRIEEWLEPLICTFTGRKHLDRRAAISFSH